MNPDEWDERMQCISDHQANSAKPLYEWLYFSLCIGYVGKHCDRSESDIVYSIPSGIGYPAYSALVQSRDGKDDSLILITCSIASTLFIVLALPLLIRKHVVSLHQIKNRL